MDHVDPFHCSTRVLTPDELERPTATQLDVLTHDTPLSPLVPAGSALATIAQLDPFHCSISVFVADAVV
jgi:hypothetical protein